MSIRSSSNSYSESPKWTASPTSSDHNYYSSPIISPGSWNVQSPQAVGATTSPNSNTTSPSSTSGYSYAESAPPNTPSSVSTQGSTKRNQDFIGLPMHLGKPDSTIEKNDLDIRRQKIAEVKARKLLQESLAKESESGRIPASPPRSHPDFDDNGYAVRQAAIRRYKEQKKLAKAGANVDGGISSSLSSLPRVIAQPRKERLATSTRKKKVASPEEDFETINDYKSVVDIEREREAERTALRLLVGSELC